jgi:hypothetical protein
MSRDVFAKLRNPWVLAMLAALIAAVAFVPAVTGGWVYDDHPLIQNNPYVHSFAHWPRWFVEDFWRLDEEFVRFDPRILYWRPAISATYAFDWTVSGGAPVWFHIENLFWHGVVGALSFVTLRRWLGGKAPAAFAAAVVFAVHPTKAESVAWISGRTDIFCTIAILLACEGIARRLAGKRGGLALEIFATVAAYTCKEQAIVLPAFAAIEHWVARGRPPIDLRATWQLVKSALPQLAVAIVYLALRRAFLPIAAAHVEGGGGLPLGDHAGVIAESFGRYFALTVAPRELSVQQGLVIVENGQLSHATPYVVLGVVGLAALIAAAVLARKRYPLVTIGIALYLATLLPTANLQFTQMRTLISERFLYLPVFGIALVIGWALDRTRARAAPALVAAVALAFGALAFSRSADYRDERRFWERELALHPDSRQARTVIIAHYVGEKRYATAMLEILKLADAKSGDRVEIAYHLAQVVSGLVPDHERASLEAIDTFCKDLIEQKPPSATLAVRELRYTITTSGPQFTRELSRFKLRLLALRVDLASRLGDDARALELAKEVIGACPRCLGVSSMASLAIARGGHYDDAIAVLDNIGPAAEASPFRKMIADARAAGERALNAAGPAQLQARASELSALELWGRAYDVLAPHKAEIQHAPNVVMGFAELAVRAGETPTAREVLAGQLSPAEIDAKIDEWSRKMGWR